MKPREVGGYLRRDGVEVVLWVTINRHFGYWLPISKAQAREIVNCAKEEEVEVIRATFDEKERALYIGGEYEVLDEAELEDPDGEEGEEQDLSEVEQSVAEEE